VTQLPNSPKSPPLSPISGYMAAIEGRDTTKPARKPRKPTLASVAKQASKAAIPVARYEIKLDGTVVIVTGTPEPAAPENPWLADLRKETKQ
jgi:hypothetical protein